VGAKCDLDWQCGSGDNGCGTFIDCGQCLDPNYQCNAYHQCESIIVCDSAGGAVPDSILPPPTCCGALPCPALPASE
jgi:hypothetical protein